MEITEDSGWIDINLSSTDKYDSVISNDLNLFFQEVAIAIHTAPGEIWGMKQAIDLRQFLWNKFVTLNQIRNEVSSYIQRNCQHSNIFQYDIDAQFINVDGKDLIYIEMKVINNGNSTDFVQKFLLGS